MATDRQTLNSDILKQSLCCCYKNRARTETQKNISKGVLPDNGAAMQTAYTTYYCLNFTAGCHLSPFWVYSFDGKPRRSCRVLVLSVAVWADFFLMSVHYYLFWNHNPPFVETNYFYTQLYLCVLTNYLPYFVVRHSKSCLKSIEVTCSVSLRSLKVEVGRMMMVMMSL